MGTQHHIAIEGSLGVGKSHLCRALVAGGHLPGHRSYMEMAAASPLLAQYYARPHRWALTFQLSVLAGRAANATAALPVHPYLYDRSLYGDYACAKACYMQGWLDADEWALYEQCWHTAYHHHKQAGLLPLVFIYLVASPTVCFERIASRARPGEHLVTLAHLEAVAECYDNLAARVAGQGTAVHRVPWAPYGSAAAVAALL